MEKMEKRKDAAEDKQHVMLHQVKRSLHQVATFLRPYLPLANAHNSDFVVSRHWHNHILPSVAADLLMLSDDELCLLPSGVLFADVSTGTTEERSDVSHKSSSQFQDASSSEQTQSFMVCENSLSNGTQQWDRTIHVRWSHTGLQAFVEDAGHNTLPQLGVLTDINRLKRQLQQHTCDKVHVSNFMSPKKSHEVDAMAEMCALLASNRGLTKIVDIGSGRGYLGCQMALMYGLKVLGIDSSETNTESAGTRAGKLGKQWEGLMRNAQEGKVGRSRRKAVKGSKETSLPQLDKVHSKDDDIPDLGLVFFYENSLEIGLENLQDNDLVNRGKSMEPETLQEIAVSDIVNKNCSASEMTMNSCIRSCNVTTTINKQQTRESNNVQSTTPHEDVCHETSENKVHNVHSTTTQKDGCCDTSVDKRQNVLPTKSQEDGCCDTSVGKRQNVLPTTSQEDVCCESLVNKRQNIPQKDACRHTSRTRRQGENTSYVAVTHYVTPELNLQALLEAHNTTSLSEKKDTDADNDGTALISGLHTCGNLAASTLRLFCTSGATTVTCNVGCCYHLLEEQFLASAFSKQEGGSTEQSGFPMSTYLRQRGCQLGRNARMLASQAPDRLANHRKLPDRSIYWRALLQEILCDVTGVQRDDWQARNDWQVGKIASKCQSFTEYVRKALQKLQFTHVKLSDEAIEEYEVTHKEQEHKMNAFFQLKAVLAPCIEALILLDRLLYLLEQDNVAVAHLVQLFDPVTSPRCYALIALK